MRYARPQSIKHALELLSRDRWRLLAGGTDFYPAQGAKPLRDNVLDINGLDELRAIEIGRDEIRIGARASWSDIVRCGLPPSFDALRLAAREVGSVQIQNMATVAGNLCNASPAADGVPPLLVLDAEVELRALGGTRRLPLSQFILGNRRTALRPDEMLTAIHVPRAAATSRSHFVKLGARRYLVISIAMAAARLVMEGGRIAEAAVAIGACSPVALRLAELETALAGRTVDDAVALAADWPMDELSPIDDVRGSAGYRRNAAREIVVRALVAAASGGDAGSLAA